MTKMNKKEAGNGPFLIPPWETVIRTWYSRTKFTGHELSVRTSF